MLCRSYRSFQLRIGSSSVNRLSVLIRSRDERFLCVTRAMIRNMERAFQCELISSKGWCWINGRSSDQTSNQLKPVITSRRARNASMSVIERTWWSWFFWFIESGNRIWRLHSCVVCRSILTTHHLFNCLHVCPFGLFGSVKWIVIEEREVDDR